MEIINLYVGFYFSRWSVLQQTKKNIEKYNPNLEKYTKTVIKWSCSASSWLFLEVTL